MYLNLHVFEFCENQLFKLLGCRFILAMTDTDLSGSESLCFQAIYNCFKCTPFTSWLMQGFKSSFVTCFSYDTNTCYTHELSYDRRNPSVVGKSFERFQHKDEPRLFHICRYASANIIKRHIILDTFLDFFDNQGDFGACRKRIKYMDTLAFVLGFIYTLCGTSGITASRKIACNGNAEYLIRISKSIKPIGCVWARGFRLAFELIQIVSHTVNIEIGIVNKLALGGNNFHRRGFKFCVR